MFYQSDLKPCFGACRIPLFLLIEKNIKHPYRSKMLGLSPHMMLFNVFGRKKHQENCALFRGVKNIVKNIVLATLGSSGFPQHVPSLLLSGQIILLRHGLEIDQEAAWKRPPALDAKHVMFKKTTGKKNTGC